MLQKASQQAIIQNKKESLLEYINEKTKKTGPKYASPYRFNPLLDYVDSY